jgi:hypothetical protein
MQLRKRQAGAAICLPTRGRRAVPDDSNSKPSPIRSLRGSDIPKQQQKPPASPSTSSSSVAQEDDDDAHSFCVSDSAPIEYDGSSSSVHQQQHPHLLQEQREQQEDEWDEQYTVRIKSKRQHVLREEDEQQQSASSSSSEEDTERRRTRVMLRAILDHLLEPWKPFSCPRGIWLEHWDLANAQETGALNTETDVRNVAQRHCLLRTSPLWMAGEAPFFCLVCNRSCNKARYECTFSMPYRSKDLCASYPPKNLLASLQELRVACFLEVAHDQRIFAANVCHDTLRHKLHWNYHYNASMLLAVDLALHDNVPATEAQKEALVDQLLAKHRENPLALPDVEAHGRDLCVDQGLL